MIIEWLMPNNKKIIVGSYTTNPISYNWSMPNYRKYIRAWQGSKKLPANSWIRKVEEYQHI